MTSQVTIVGNVCRQPELRFTASGQPIVGFGVAVNRRWQNKTSNEWQEDTSFFDVTAFAPLAENVADSIQKGTRVIVTGRLQQRSYETQDGGKRSVVEIVADEVGPSLRWATAQVDRNERSSGERQPAKTSSYSDADSEPF